MWLDLRLDLSPAINRALGLGQPVLSSLLCRFPDPDRGLGAHKFYGLVSRDVIAKPGETDTALRFVLEGCHGLPCPLPLLCYLPRLPDEEAGKGYPIF